LLINETFPQWSKNYVYIFIVHSYENKLILKNKNYLKHVKSELFLKIKKTAMMDRASIFFTFLTGKKVGLGQGMLDLVW